VVGCLDKPLADDVDHKLPERKHTPLFLNKSRHGMGTA
jgi:hypothetical protein